MKHKGIAAVTGGRGKIGSHIVQRLLDKGWTVRVLTRNPDYKAPIGVQVVFGDLSEPSALNRLIAGSDAVFHCAAELSQEEHMVSVNIQGTENVLEAIRRYRVDYLCYLSSVGVSGPCQDSWVSEKSPCKPVLSYERSKWEAEKLVSVGVHGCNICILRPTNVVSSKQPGIVQLSIRNNFKDRMIIHLKGKEYARLVHADDVAAAAIFFAKKELTEPNCFIVSCDDDGRNTVAGIYSLCRTLIEQKDVENVPQLWSLPLTLINTIRKTFRGASLPGYVRFSSAKIRKAGFEFPLGLEGGLREIIEHAQTEKLE